MSSLPITRRGNFFKDSYFQNDHNDFENAMDKVMDKFGGRSLLADQFTKYRQLKRENSEVGGAASISDTDHNYIIVLDMSDFLSGSITVCTSGKNAVVEANFGKKNFYQKFPLPSCCNIDGVKSAMSDEGILTINAPKKVSRRVGMPVADDSSSAEVSETKCQMKEEDLGNVERGKITVESLNLGNKMEDNCSQSTPETPTKTRRVSIDRRGNFFQDSKFENIWSDFEKSMEDMMGKEKNRREERNADKAERRAQRDAVFEKISKQFFEDSFPKKSNSSFKREAMSRNGNKQKSFEENISNIREQFFGESLPKRNDSFFDDNVPRKTDDFFGDDFSERKKKFFERDSSRRDNFFDDDSIKGKNKLFEDYSTKTKENFFEKDSFGRDNFFEKSSPSKKDKFFDDDFVKDKFCRDDSTTRKDRLFEEEYLTRKKDNLSDNSANKTNKLFEEDTKSDLLSSDAPIYDRFRKYRNLRNWDPASDTQAVSVKQSNDSYKILLDAKGVDSNSLSVQAKDDGLLVSGGDGRNAFKRKFSLPGAISFDKVNANLSEDGILIITIPKN